jgi:hypothetical protein
MNENYLSFDVVFIALAYFLNQQHSSLKYAIQFFLVDDLQNLLHAVKKLIFISHLNPFEFLLYETNRSHWKPNQMNRVGVAYGTYHVLRANLLKLDLCELSNCRDEPQVISDTAPFFEEKLLVQVE